MNNPHTISGTLRHETPKAWLIRVEGYQAPEVWIPKSQAITEDGFYTLPAWLVRAKGLFRWATKGDLATALGETPDPLGCENCDGEAVGCELETTEIGEGYMVAYCNGTTKTVENGATTVGRWDGR